MSYHQSSAVSVATAMTAATVIILGYRLGRAHAAWQDVRSTKRDLPVKRRTAWGHTRALVIGAVLLLASFLAAVYQGAH
jgi:hypothetical protein